MPDRFIVWVILVDPILSVPTSLKHLQRFQAQRDPIPPLWQQSIAERSLETSYCRMCFWMDRFGGFDELTLRVVMCQIGKKLHLRGNPPG